MTFLNFFACKTFTQCLANRLLRGYRETMHTRYLETSVRKRCHLSRDWCHGDRIIQHQRGNDYHLRAAERLRDSGYMKQKIQEFLYHRSFFHFDCPGSLAPICSSSQESLPRGQYRPHIRNTADSESQPAALRCSLGSCFYCLWLLPVHSETWNLFSRDAMLKMGRTIVGSRISLMRLPHWFLICDVEGF